MANLITNGTFDTDVSGWTAAANPPSSISHVSPANRMKVTSDGDANGIGLQAISVSVGVQYNLSFDGFEIDGDSWGYILANSDETIAYEDTSFTGDQSVSFDFEATDTTMIVGLVNATTNDGTSTDFDNVVVDLSAVAFEASPGVLTLTGLSADVAIPVVLEASPGVLLLTGISADAAFSGVVEIVRFMFPPVPLEYPDPVEWLRRIARNLNFNLEGKHNAVGDVTLSTGQTTTAVVDLRVGAASVISLMPLTANASAEIGSGTIYVSARGDGTFTLTHANNTQGDRTFQYVIDG